MGYYSLRRACNYAAMSFTLAVDDSMPAQNGRLAMGRFIIEFGDRLSDHL